MRELEPRLAKHSFIGMAVEVRRIGQGGLRTTCTARDDNRKEQFQISLKGRTCQENFCLFWVAFRGNILISWNQYPGSHSVSERENRYGTKLRPFC